MLPCLTDKLVSVGVSQQGLAALMSLAAAVFTVVGGVGGGLYMAYFACAGVLTIVMVYFFDAFYMTTDSTMHEWGFAYDDRPVIDTVCEIIQCARTHSMFVNRDHSAFTFLSLRGFFAGILCLLCKSSCNFEYKSFVNSWLNTVSVLVTLK